MASYTIWVTTPQSGKYKGHQAFHITEEDALSLCTNIEPLIAGIIYADDMMGDRVRISSELAHGDLSTLEEVA